MSKNDLSSLENLSKTSNDHSPSSGPRRRWRFPAWLLPVGLVVGFLLVLVLLFGERLLPAVPVKVAPVITIRTDREIFASAPSSTQTSTPSSGSAPKSLLFQASGWIEPDPFAISVSTLVGGIVDEVYVLEGETVTKGQQLAKLIDEDAILDVEEARARTDTLRSEIQASLSKIPVVESRRTGSVSDVDFEKGKLAELEDRLNRLQSLPRGSIPVVDVTAARLQVEQQRAKVRGASSDLPGIDSEIEMVKSEIAAKRAALREAEVALAKAQLALDRHVIRSPMSGVVLQLHAAPGRKRMIHMDDHKSGYIVELFDPQKLQARIDVPLSEAAALSVGQPVEMICDLLPNITLQGVVTRITGEADLQRNTLQVKVAVKNPDSRLRPEMLVRGKFYPIPKPPGKGNETNHSTITGGRLSLYIPREAIIDANQVWVVGTDNRAEKRTITLADDIRDGYQNVMEGVRSGEEVILPPHEKIKPGVRVKIIQ